MGRAGSQLVYKREVVVPDPEVDRHLVTKRRKGQRRAVERGNEMIARIRGEVDRWGELKLVNPLDIVEVIARLIHAVGPV